MIHSSPITIGQQQRFGRCCFKSTVRNRCGCAKTPCCQKVTGDNAAVRYVDVDVDGSTGAKCSFFLQEQPEDFGRLHNNKIGILTV
jgi:hypothetical protein